MSEIDRIKELQKMSQQELIDLVLKLESGVRQLKNDVNRLEGENEKITVQKDKYKTDAKKYKENIKSNEKKHNERGAGRKNKFTSEQVKEIQLERDKGKSIRAIAKEFNCSASLVHKLIHKHNK